MASRPSRTASSNGSTTLTPFVGPKTPRTSVAVRLSSGAGRRALSCLAPEAFKHAVGKAALANTEAGQGLDYAAEGREKRSAMGAYGCMSIDAPTPRFG
jgi:hypothetical protein